MAGAGIVANETIRGAEGRDQRIEITLRVVDDRDRPAEITELGSDLFETPVGPTAHSLRGPGVHDDVASCRFFAYLRCELPIKMSRDLSPRGNSMWILWP